MSIDQQAKRTASAMVHAVMTDDKPRFAELSDPFVGDASFARILMFNLAAFGQAAVEMAAKATGNDPVEMLEEMALLLALTDEPDEGGGGDDGALT